MSRYPDATLGACIGDVLARALVTLGRARRELSSSGDARVETWFHANGKRRRVLTFERGELVKVERYWRDGARRTLGHVKNGRADGEWFLVKRDGALDRAKTGLYREGRWIGGIRGFNDWLGSA